MNFVGYYRLPPVRGVFFSPAQEERLLLLGCQEVFSDRCLAGGVVRSGLDRALTALEPGGVLAVPSLHALAGAMVDLLDVVRRLRALNLDLVVVQPPIDTRSDAGFFEACQILATFNGERSLVRNAEATMIARGAPREERRAVANSGETVAEPDLSSSDDSLS
ncbi:recombinase family protein [Caulobacter sp. HMWF025]|uniref:recombinase family protein n=2 Tax=unclassified Caulobacter TaxID=2648921 RepID=UPI000D339894|nr:recombinase family protein [Caulobacter sp. HMWF025]PTT09669.1 DNA invertase [Caulobacter sp. HMWF025]